MNFLTAIFYGFIQGFAEFLPISSSGHLSLLQNMFGVENVEESYFTFNVLLHLGTLTAVFIVYRKDVWLLIKSFISLCGKLFSGKLKQGLTSGERLFVMLLIATLPLVPAALLSDKIEALYSMSKLIGVFLIINGAVLYISDKLSKKRYDLNNIKYRNVLCIGLMQFFGLLPGISRSGSTITGGLFNGLERKDAVKFSFLLSIPAILGANILSIFDLKDNPVPSDMWGVYLIGMISAAIFGILAIKLLQYITKKNKFGYFAIYCLAVGVLAIIFG